jgi:hypothetical protein
VRADVVPGDGRLPAAAAAYVQAIVERVVARERLISIVVFGSSTTGGFSAAVSDVDLLLVVADAVSEHDIDRLRDDVAGVEAQFSFASGDRGQRSRALDAVVARLTATVRSFFICRRADLLAGSASGILGIGPLQARFVDRIAISSVIGSAMTAWGEDLLPAVALPPIRRVDVLMAFQSFFLQLMLLAVVVPVAPRATKHALDVLKRSVHNCYFCYHGRPAALDAEVAFLRRRVGGTSALDQLLDLRGEYRSSVRFVFRCLPAVARMHLRTLRDNTFPRRAAGRV